MKVFTSGSTGKPKEIDLPESDMLVSARATCRRFNIGKDSTLFCPLPMDRIAGIMMRVRADVSGAALIVEDPSSMPLKSDPACDIDLAAIVPAQIEGLLASPFVKRVKSVIIGGAPLSNHHLELLATAPFTAWATYGMTETCSHVALRCITTGEKCFEAMPGIRFSCDSEGCLVIESEGYSWKRLATRDVVELRDDRHFRWIGRADSIINSGGLKVCPEEAEAHLSKILPEGMEYRVAPRASDKWGQEAVIEIVDPDGKVTDDKIPVEGLSFRLRIVHVDEIPKTPTGKILRHS